MFGVQGHIMSECHLSHLPQDVIVKQANALHNYHARPPNDPLTPLHTIRAGGIIQNFPTKPQTLILTMLPKVIPILSVSNIEPLHNTNFHHAIHKNPIYKI